MFYVRMKNKKRVIVLIFYISRVIINKQYFLYIRIWNIKNMQKVLICRTELGQRIYLLLRSVLLKNRRRAYVRSRKIKEKVLFVHV